MIEELIARVFHARNVTHFRHLTSKRYSEHMALGGFYEDVVGAVDLLVESYIGQFGEIEDLPQVSPEVDDLVEYLRDEADWIEVNRDEISNQSSAVGNLVDGVTAIYLTAIYKLENLQ